MAPEQDANFAGRHYETGTISNWLTFEGNPVSEALALGASGGIAFGYFVFEYSGYLPHVALLTRNTFAPFDRALDNLGIRRETQETVKPEKGLENLRRELDNGHSVVIWADMFTCPWNILKPDQAWAMLPMLVVGYEDDGFWLVDQSSRGILVPTEELQAVRGRVKKDRFRIMTLHGVDESRWKAGLEDGIRTCTALFLDKPPAGSVKNFGIAGMEHCVQMLRDNTTALGWGKKFPPGDKFKQAVIGKHGQPGIWDWIERWGSNPGADRGTYAAFLLEAGVLLGKDIESVATQFDASAKLWSELSLCALPDSVPALKSARETKQEMARLRFEEPIGSIYRRKGLLSQLEIVWDEAGDLSEESMAIRESMAKKLEEIIPIEKSAILQLRSLVG